MRKQNNFRLSKTKNNILYILSGATLALFAGLMLFPTINETTHAEGDEPEDGITVVANNNIEINLLSTDQGYYKIAKDTVTVSTGSEYGYTLYLSTDSAAHQSIYLNGDTSSESKISGTTGTYESPAALSDEGYSWGWAVPGISHFDNVYNTTNPDAKSKFAVMPLENKIIHEYTTEATEDTTDIYYGFKLEGTLEPGEYETAISYTAVSADAPLVARAILGDNGNLNFVYDRNTYTTGETYTDNIGETEITNVYEAPMNSVGCTDRTRMPWSSSAAATANVDDLFANARPTGTCGWFINMKDITSITNLQNLNMSSVTDIDRMFYDTGYNADVLNLDGINNWDTGNVTDMKYTFYRTGANNATFNLNLSGWDTSNVTDMQQMFYATGASAESFNLNLSGWNTGKVTTMYFMFSMAGRDSTDWDIDGIDGWNTSNVTSMYSTFQYAGNSATTFNLDLSSWNVGSVRTMQKMFDHAGQRATTWNIGDLGNWDTSGVIYYMDSMFAFAGTAAATWNIGNLDNWDVSKVTNMSKMFARAGYNATTWNIGDIGGWDTGSVKRMDEMFNYAGYKAATWNIGNLGYIDEEHKGWDTGSVTNMSNMFSYAGYNATDWNIGDIHAWNVGSVTNHTDFINRNVNRTNTSVVNNQPQWN